VFRVSLAGSGAHDPEISPPEGAAVRDIKVTATAVMLASNVLHNVFRLQTREFQLLTFMCSCVPAGNGAWTSLSLLHAARSWMTKLRLLHHATCMCATCLLLRVLALVITLPARDACCAACCCYLHLR
jgi:hypothetical protein